MSKPDPGSVIRIAIALAALKLKPRDQPTASYLLDLKSSFPLTTKGYTSSDGRDWRTYALELEKQLAALKAQRDADQESSQVASSSDAPPAKKSKKNPPKHHSEPEWSWDQSHADWSRFLSSQYPSPPSIVATYTSLRGVLISPDADLPSHASRLTDAILRALDTMYIFLFSPANPSPGLHAHTVLGAPSQSHLHVDGARIAMASPLLMYTLRTALPALLRVISQNRSQCHNAKTKRQCQRIHPAGVAPAHVDNVLDHLLECIFLPLLRALKPLCFARLAPLVTPPPKKTRKSLGKGKRKDKENERDRRAKRTTDARTDAFALIGTALDALDGLLRPPGADRTGVDSIAADIRDRLGLETIRELEVLFAVPFRPDAAEQPPQAPGLDPPSDVLPPPTPFSVQFQTSQHEPQQEPRTQQLGSRTKRLEKLVGTRTDRVRALAIRDAGWFLASMLNLCVTPAPASTSASETSTARAGVQCVPATGGLLREALLNRIGKLVRLYADGHDYITGPNSECANIDPVCRNMLLAVCERTLTRFAPC